MKSQDINLLIMQKTNFNNNNNNILLTTNNLITNIDEQQQHHTSNRVLTSSIITTPTTATTSTTNSINSTITSTTTNNNNNNNNNIKNWSKIQSLKQRKCELEKLLNEKNLLLQQIKKQEAQIIGEQNHNYDGNCGLIDKNGNSTILRRKIGASYKLPKNLLSNSKEDGDIEKLLLEKKIQQEICNAAFKLANDSNISKSIRRTHKAEYEAAQQKLISIHHNINKKQNQFNNTISSLSSSSTTTTTTTTTSTTTITSISPSTKLLNSNQILHNSLSTITTGIVASPPPSTPSSSLTAGISCNTIIGSQSSTTSTTTIPSTITTSISNLIKTPSIHQNNNSDCNNINNINININTNTNTNKQCNIIENILNKNCIKNNNKFGNNFKSYFSVERKNSTITPTPILPLSSLSSSSSSSSSLSSSIITTSKSTTNLKHFIDNDDNNIPIICNSTIIDQDRLMKNIYTNNYDINRFVPDINCNNHNNIINNCYATPTTVTPTITPTTTTTTSSSSSSSLYLSNNFNNNKFQQYKIDDIENYNNQQHDIIMNCDYLNYNNHSNGINNENNINAYNIHKTPISSFLLSNHQQLSPIHNNNNNQMIMKQHFDVTNGTIGDINQQQQQQQQQHHHQQQQQQQQQNQYNIDVMNDKSNSYSYNNYNRKYDTVDVASISPTAVVTNLQFDQYHQQIGLGGYWRILPNNERVWCVVENW